MATPDKMSPSHRRIRLLEARLASTPKPADTPVARSPDHSATPVPQRAPILASTVPVPVSTPLISAAPPPLENTESVRSFSSDAALPPPLPTPAPNARRKYAPPPPQPSSRPSKQQRKRKRQSPAPRRNGRVDAFFKPVTPSATGTPPVARRLVLALHDRTSPATATCPRTPHDNPTANAVTANAATAAGSASSAASRQASDTSNSSRPGSSASRPTNNNPPSSNTPVSTPAPPPPPPPPPEDLMDVMPDGNEDDDESYQHLRAMIDSLKLDNDRLNEENSSLRQSVTQLEDDLNTARAESEDLAAQVECDLPTMRTELDEKERALDAATNRCVALENMLTKIARSCARLSREKSERDSVTACLRLGRPAVERRGTSFQEIWEDGEELRRLETQLREVVDERFVIDQKRKDVLKKRKREGIENDMPPPSLPVVRANVPFEDTANFATEQEEIYRVRLVALKRTENSIMEQHAKLIRERDLLVRELRRQKDERLSKFGDFRILNERYVLLNLLGKGGFSEVFKAVDLREGTYVACKIHQLAYSWSEEKKQNFVKHAMREYDIHKTLQHPRMVKLVDIFEINGTSFCTVLEYCDGCDLDTYLRANKQLPEKEAKSIITQVFSGLLYLAEQQKRIIHYDLKPGNILLHKGEVQITDFGLSKVMSETETTADGMELTSQGAGTMWYLPPECFEPASQARISGKVDIWSAGVILYQMLYGRKPFGHDQSQEKMFREKTVQHQDLMFPPKPAVSDAAKDLMSKCFARKPADRPDVREIISHPFIKKK